MTIACFGLAHSAYAEVHVSGKASALKIEARDATLDEVLRALQSSFKIQYRGTGGLSDAVSGSYSGSLPAVVNRLLAGHDFVMHGPADDLDVVIFGPPGTANRGSGAPAANHATGAAQGGDGPAKDCQYKDGDRIIPVEC